MKKICALAIIAVGASCLSKVDMGRNREVAQPAQAYGESTKYGRKDYGDPAAIAVGWQGYGNSTDMTEIRPDVVIGSYVF